MCQRNFAKFSLNELHLLVEVSADDNLAGGHQIVAARHRELGVGAGLALQVPHLGTQAE